MASMVAAVSDHETALLCVRNEAHRDQVIRLLQRAHADLSGVQFGFANADDVWVRDHGPIGTVSNDGHLLLHDFAFNGWGKKYPYTADNQITPTLFQQNVFPPSLFDSHALVLEGGSIDVNGRGCLLTTRSCLMAPSRNPQMTEADIASRLSELFCIDEILWLDHGALEGDDTDGHIDTLARFTDEHTVAYVRCDDPSDPHFAEFEAMERQLHDLMQTSNHISQLVPLPWAGTHRNADGHRLPATYANFLITNEKVLLPVYGVAQDAAAHATLRALFPSRDIVRIDAVPLIHQYGSVHCMTMNIPARPGDRKAP